MVKGDVMKLTVIGCSDAFGSGGRLQTSFHIQSSASQVLIDCGATTLIGLARENIDPNQISVIFISHLHGDHYSGLVWWLLHARHVAHRTRPLTIVGPTGLQDRLDAASEILFPGSSGQAPDFDLKFLTYAEPEPLAVDDITVTPFVVSHPSGATSYALRLQVDGKTIAFSGDTEWVETLVPAAQDADLYITECFAYDSDVRYHMNWQIISKNLARLTAKTIMLTHMGPEMLARRQEVAADNVILAEDGLVLDL